jgi:hypothetical protein
MRWFAYARLSAIWLPTDSWISGKLLSTAVFRLGPWKAGRDCQLDGVGLAAVKDILDRAGYKPVNQIEQTNYDV